MSSVEIENVTRHCEVVQFPKRIWIYSAARRRKRCVCPHLGCRESWPQRLNEGQAIEYEEVTNKGKTSAENLKVQRR
jgi:hypothetical protein